MTVAIADCIPWHRHLAGCRKAILLWVRGRDARESAAGTAAFILNGYDQRRDKMSRGFQPLG
jgi:hypothetical protein